MNLRQVTLDDKFQRPSGDMFMSGIDALVRLPILQHQRDCQSGLNTAGFVSGYRGSPLGGLDQTFWKASQWLQDHNIVFKPGVNEELAMTSVWGSQQINLFDGAKYDGVFGLWYGKGPGLDRSVDALRHANAFGTSPHGGVLVVVGDDHGCKSSTYPYQSEHVFMGVSAPVLAPANVQEILDYGVLGWAMSRYSGCYVGLKAITENVDSSMTVEVDPVRLPVRYPDSVVAPQGGFNGRLHDTPLAQEERLNRHKIYAAREFARANHIDRITHDSRQAKLGIITSGKAWLDVLQALEDLGIDAEKAAKIRLRIYKVGMPWPLEPVGVHEFARGLKEILVVEEKRSIIEDQLTGQLYNWPVRERPRVVGEKDELGQELLGNLGELTPALVAQSIAVRLRPIYTDMDIERRLQFLAVKKQSLAQTQRPLRTPHYCSGCPHNSSTVVPEGSRALGGIGCHYMVTWMHRATDTFSQMGGEGAAWIGQSPFTRTEHVFQNLGDGTYFHSGILAIRAAISAGVNITYKILYNDAVAMTGGQPLDGQLSIADLLDQLRSEGVQRIALVSDEPEKYPAQLTARDGLSVHHRRRLNNVQETMRQVTGVSVLVYDQTCAAEKRRRHKVGALGEPKRRVYIHPELCEGCGDCSRKSNCLSVEPLQTDLGRKRRINQHACNKDFSCVEGFCPSFISLYGADVKTGVGAPSPLLLQTLTMPSLRKLDGAWNLVVAGVGGTGVLTVSAILGMAAHLENKGSSVLNLTGLAQKFGAVVSHVRIAKDQRTIRAVRVPAGDAHLLLGCDLIVSAGDDALSKVNSDFSHAVINDHLSPTAEFIANPDVDYPIAEMKSAIEGELGEGRASFVDASDLSEELLGDPIAANSFLMGYAWQQGLIPLEQASIFRAIEINNVAVVASINAFQWGRLSAAGIGVSREGQVDVQELDVLEDVVRDRSRRLVSYQNESYAQRYRDFVERCRERESMLDCRGDYPFTFAVAKAYYRLLAYKDEYEVARLLSAESFKTKLRATFNGNYRVHYHFAIPLLNRLNFGRQSAVKIEYGAWMSVPLKALAKLKCLRGSWFDIFSYTKDRKLDKSLIFEFERLVDRDLLPKLNRKNLSAAIDVINSTETIRGYGHVRSKSVMAWRNGLSQKLANLNPSDADTVQIINFDKVV